MQIFSVSFSKCFQEFREPAETSGATGEKLLSWAKMHQCWLVSDPADLATMWPDLVMGVGFGAGIFAWHWSSCFVDLLQHRWLTLLSH